MFRYKALLFLLLNSPLCFSQTKEDNFNNYLNSSIKRIEGEHDFAGLAAYYNNIIFLAVRSDSYNVLHPEVEYQFKQDETFVALSRFKAITIAFEDKVSTKVNPNQVLFSLPLNNSVALNPIVSQKSEVIDVFPHLDRFHYESLWKPFEILARAFERVIVKIQESSGLNWGITIVVFAIALKVLLLPLSILTTRLQRQASQIQSRLNPALLEIKKTHKGEEAHNRIMEAHKKMGVTPFYALKPMSATLIQIPILIAVFNTLGETPELDGATFLWIDSLSNPDVIAKLPFSIPLLGSSVSLLPFIMTAITILSAFLYTNQYATRNELRKQRRNLCLMGGVFFLLFYPFPSSMVLYWSTSNLLHIFQQRLIKI